MLTEQDQKKAFRLLDIKDEAGLWTIAMLVECVIIGIPSVLFCLFGYADCNHAMRILLILFFLLMMGAIPYFIARYKFNKLIKKGRPT